MQQVSVKLRKCCHKNTYRISYHKARMDESKAEEGRQQFQNARTKDYLRLQPTLKLYVTNFFERNQIKRKTTLSRKSDRHLMIVIFFTYYIIL